MAKSWELYLSSAEMRLLKMIVSALLLIAAVLTASALPMADGRVIYVVYRTDSNNQVTDDVQTGTLLAAPLKACNLGYLRDNRNRCRKAF